MLPQMATLTDVAAKPERRRGSRRNLSLALDIAAPGKNTDVFVLDVSRTGMLIESSISLETGEIIDIELPHAGVIQARVARYENNHFGMQFPNPISEAAVSAVLLSAPAVPPAATPSAVTPERTRYDAVIRNGLEPELNFSAALGMAGVLWLIIAAVAYLAMV